MESIFKTINCHDRLKLIFYNLLGGFFVVFLCIIVSTYFSFHKSQHLFIIPENLYTHQIDSVSLNYLKKQDASIKELREHQIIFTPNEYTDHIADYYNTLICMLIAMFGIFSIIGYFAIKKISLDEIAEQVKLGLLDSTKIRQSIINDFESTIIDRYATVDQLDDISRKVDSLESIFSDDEEGSSDIYIK